MPDKKNIVIIGYSGHSFVVLDAAKEMNMNVKYYCEKKRASFNPFEIDYLGNEGSDSFDWNCADEFILGIGDNKIRQKVANLILSKKKIVLNVVHPSSIISNYAIFGVGNFIAANVTINAFAKILDNCILNTGCIVEHECVIESGVHIAPGAVLAGNVHVGENSFIGANSVVKQGVKIGDAVTVGAGSVVIKDIPDNEIWAGNPAKKLK
ncbi:acetyltransferase [Chryseobacterium taiwanense]|uniref:N-acetylneuraminate synthase n=1 Tax=Chryseobacterium taiwanense TaxID=363331 RepID=A0A0B4DG78_9FLAO|nr:acetyltransferase [Chryseobacterium taiwanense]KIC63410.1 N-acetylneuraminate synthase [Chryseobacterium taiwanense]